MSELRFSDLLVALVEPSTTQQKVISNYLVSYGVDKIELYGEGRSALAAMRRTQPDLVISAMHLPDMTGTELVQSMRGSTNLRDIPFMLISSETNIRYLEPIRQAGAIAILPKPFEPENLRGALMATLDFVDPTNLKADNFSVEELRVLVVDDSPMARRYVRKVLSNMGIVHMTDAEDGQAAIRILSMQSFDLMVTDYNMPEVDGAALVRYVRTEGDNPSMPILMVTSETDVGRLAQVEQAGVSAICDKPFEPRNVRDLLERILVH